MNTSDDVHAITQQLLPWYMNRTLGQAEHRQVEEHIRDCLACRRDIKNLTPLAAVLNKPSADISASDSFTAMHARMAVAASSAAAGDGGATDAHVTPLHRKPFIRFALAASLLLALLPAGMDLLRENSADARYYTLSAPAPTNAGAADLRVVFAADTSPETITSALAAAGAHATGAANSSGALDLRLQGSATREQALALLRARKDVLLAEPVTQP